MNKIIPVVMAGGSGTRLWPLSRKLYPKQFLPLNGENTMLQDTLARLSNKGQHCSWKIAEPIVVCNNEHRFIVAEQLRQADYQSPRIILEPAGRNTAPAAALAALQASVEDPDALLLILAADHLIRDEQAFHRAIEEAVKVANQDKLATFGVTPRHPETGYGYIKSESAKQGPSAIEKFVEKPDLETAREFLKQGSYFWNSGMFLFKASIYLKELGRHRPDILEASTASFEGRSNDLEFIRLAEKEFLDCADESIDYAVMENTDRAMVVPLDAGWSDVGSWSSLWNESEHDASGNACRGDVIQRDSSNNMLYSDHKLIAAVGIENLVVVATPDAVLVSSKDKAQEVKAIVDQLRTDNRSEALLHREVARPWGSYDSIDMGERFQVKRIKVNPGAKLSLQMHHHRAEHWIVVSGTALVTIDDEERLLSENESTYIPIGTTHRLENPGVLPLEMIEVQSGSYLGEDDIVRFEDTYGRDK